MKKGISKAYDAYEKATDNLYQAVKAYIDAGFKNRKTANTIASDFREVMYYFANECSRMEEVHKK